MKIRRGGRVSIFAAFLDGIKVAQCLLYLINLSFSFGNQYAKTMTMRITSLVILLLACALVPSAHAMDRWSALSMIESGNNDSAVGSLGEISRYQIRPKLWPGGNPHNRNLALSVAQKIMRARLDKFLQTHHNRAPSDFEFYVLWNAPQQVNHPCRAVAERAERFANLVTRID